MYVINYPSDMAFTEPMHSNNPNIIYLIIHVISSIVV